MSGTQAIGRRTKGPLDALGRGLARAAVSTAVLTDPLDTTRAHAAQKQLPIGLRPRRGRVKGPRKGASQGEKSLTRGR
jgi:hypothetical protein